LQDPEGYWCADLTADTTLESDYILLQLWMHPPEAGVWNPPTRAFIDKAVRSILARQLPDGGFNIYVKGPSEISATVKAYFALKVAGLPLDDPRLARARERILELGGIQAANSYVKINLSLFDMYPRSTAPPSRRRSCFCRAISSTRCRPGRAPSWFRWPSCIPATRAARCPPDSTWTSFTSRESALDSSRATASSRGAISS
jgi:hypothetical protein